MLRIKNELEGIFNGITKELDAMDEIRERLFTIQRAAVRKSSEIIKQVHRREFNEIEKEFEDIKKIIAEFDSTIKQLPIDLPKDYELIVKQEYGEAIIFYNLISKKKLMEPVQIGLNSYQYCYAIADVVGELRRFCLSCLIENKIEEALEIFGWMEDVYNVLFSLDYPSGLLPGLRKKIDTARNSLNNTQSEISLIVNLKRYGVKP